MEKRNSLASIGTFVLAVALGELDSADACQDIENARAFIEEARAQLNILLQVANDAAIELNAVA